MATYAPIPLPTLYPAPVMPQISPGDAGSQSDFGFVIDTDGKTGFNSLADGVKDGIPADYRIDIRHRKNHGIYLLPVCGGLEGSPGEEGETDPLAKPQLIALHSPYGEKLADWTCERHAGTTDGKPSLPPLPLAKKDDKSEGCALEDITIVSPSPAQGTTRVFRISGEYHYLMVDSVASGDELPMGWNPHDGTDADFDKNKIGKGAPYWQHGIVHSGNSSSSLPPNGSRGGNE